VTGQRRNKRPLLGMPSAFLTQALKADHNASREFELVDMALWLQSPSALFFAVASEQKKEADAQQAQPTAPEPGASVPTEQGNATVQHFQPNAWAHQPTPDGQEAPAVRDVRETPLAGERRDAVRWTRVKGEERTLRKSCSMTR